MATNGKVFVSPGVYTSEVDLSFCSTKCGSYHIGYCRWNFKGSSFWTDIHQKLWGISNLLRRDIRRKFINTQIPKYEAAYIAKSYLQQSNQLFVTRVFRTFWLWCRTILVYYNSSKCWSYYDWLLLYESTNSWLFTLLWSCGL